MSSRSSLLSKLPSSVAKDIILAGAPRLCLAAVALKQQCSSGDAVFTSPSLQPKPLLQCENFSDLTPRTMPSRQILAPNGGVCRRITANPATSHISKTCRNTATLLPRISSASIAVSPVRNLVVWAAVSESHTTVCLQSGGRCLGLVQCPAPVVQ